MKNIDIKKMTPVIDGKHLWAIIDDYGHTMFQIFSVKEPIYLKDKYNVKVKELA